MKKHALVLWLSVCTGICAFGQLSKQDKQSARAVIERINPAATSNLRIESLEKENDCDVFEQEIKNGKLVVRGSSPVAVCKGFYDFARQNGYGHVSWTGNRLEIPQNIVGSTRRVVSPVPHHYYFNVVTYGYTMPYWDWSRWEKEIDWMALHGIDMPLTLVANEAISARVWKKLGLTDEEISAYFVGPAHLPWMRMGNISGIDGPMPASWHEDQVDLQHRILKRMRSLGMKPICPGFAGFIPQAFKRLYPDLNIIETSWGGAFHNWMLSPEEDLFHEIGKLFIQEWEKEFGKNDYYIVDSFNELEIPFPPKDSPERYKLLASYGEKVYASIKDGNPDATWVMQGWMFGYQRYIWDYETLQALVSKVPDDKMLLLDLAVDYNANFWKSTYNWEFYKGFYNKPWVYSVIPNMGGKSGFTGILEFYANGHQNALHSENKGRMTGIGMAPEGIENNEVIYELMADAGWSNDRIDLQNWLHDYTVSRYGSYDPAFDAYWKGLQNSVFGTFTDHPRFNWQFRPGLVQRGSICINDDYFRAFEAFASCAGKFKGNALYEADLRENMAMYLGGKLEILVTAISQAYLNNDQPLFDRYTREFEEIALKIDALLDAHPTLTLAKWLDFAVGHATTPEEKDYYERNARRIVTVWGPPVDDYSARIWSGLIRDYYLPRWKNYFTSLKQGVPADLKNWELNWVENQRGLSSAAPQEDLLAQLPQLVRSVAHLNTRMLDAGEHVLANFSQADFNQGTATISCAVSVDALKKMNGIRITHLQGKSDLRVTEIRIMMDGKEVARTPVVEGELNRDKPHYFQNIELDPAQTGNNGCELTVVLQGANPVSELKGKVVLTEQSGEHRSDRAWRSGILTDEFIYDEAPFPSVHSATIAETPEGLVCAFFGGTHEGNPDVCIYTSRHLDGKWQAPVQVFDGVINDTLRKACYNPVLYQVPGEELLLFYKIGKNVQDWSGYMSRSFDSGATWSEPEALPEGFLGPIKNRPELIGGNLICPSSTEDKGWRVHFEYTADKGKTWNKSAVVNDSTFDIIQPSILFLKDGRKQMVCRSRNEQLISAYSRDGIHWDKPFALNMPNNNSGTDAVTLKDGRHLLVYNHKKMAESWDQPQGRTPINVAVSSDGLNWEAALILEDSPIKEYSYPSVIQGKDGKVHIVYTWRREKIKYVCVDPAKLQTRPIVNEEWPLFTF